MPCLKLKCLYGIFFFFLKHVYLEIIYQWFSLAEYYCFEYASYLENPPTNCQFLILKYLKQKVMDLQLCSGSPLPLIWAIEALACSDHVEPSLLIDLLKKTPQSFNNIGKNATELVSLKILESLFIQGARANPISSALCKKVRLDPSDHCEDVLGRIVSETSLSHMNSAVPEMSKWDLEPFIAHKKSTLRICALKQLKDAIVTGALSISASLKEKSGLPVGRHTEHQSPAIDGYCNAPRVEGSNTDDGNLMPSDLPDGNLPPVNRKRRASESPAEQLCTININLAKKNKHAIISNEQHVGGQLIIYNQDSLETANSRDRHHLADASKRYREESCSFVSETCTEVMRQYGSPGDGNDQGNSSKGLARNVLNEKFDVAMQNNEGENTVNVWDGFHGHVLTNQDSNKKADKNIPGTVAADGEAEDGVDNSSDKDGYHGERMTIDTKKKAFLSSQCTYSQDSLATSYERELDLCMKCHKGGSLLSCTSDSCPIVIHESCLGSDKSFDARETFYCPFCAYTRAISTYMDVKEYVSLARKELSTFICRRNI